MDIDTIGDSGTMDDCAIGRVPLCFYHCLCSISNSAIGVSLLYGKMPLVCYSAIGDSETYDDFRLTAKFCVLPVRWLVQALRCPQSLRAEAFVRCGGKKAVSGGRYGDNKVAITTLLG